MNHLTQRLIASLLICLLIFSAIYFSVYPYFRPVFTLITAVIIGTALWELYHIAKGKGYHPLSLLGITASILWLFATYLKSEYTEVANLPWVIMFLFSAGSFFYFFIKGTNPFVNLALTFFGVWYLTLPLSLLIPINFDFGRSFLLYLILVAKMTDVGAYFVGVKWGKHKLAPYISPNKTYEGALGGLIVGVIVSFLLTVIFTHLQFSLLEGLGLGIAVSLFSQFGDLTESLLKRDLGVKDSNHLPGLGGMLDVVDSLVFATPMLYFYLVWTRG